MLEFDVQMWPISAILPYPQNARKIPQAAIDKVAKSIQEFGWQQPIVVEPTGVIVVGHVRRLAALQLGLIEAPVHVARDLTPTQLRAYRLMDNRSHEDAKWDAGILTLELQELKLEGLDLELTGFSGAERDRALLTGNEHENDVPAVPVVPAARPGDVWLCGPHRIICGDCTHPDVVKRVLNGEAPLLMVTDPPYGIELDSEWRDRAGLNGGIPGAKRDAFTKEYARKHNTASGARSIPSTSTWKCSAGRDSPAGRQRWKGTGGRLLRSRRLGVPDGCLVCIESANTRRDRRGLIHGVFDTAKGHKGVGVDVKPRGLALERARCGPSSSVEPAGELVAVHSRYRLLQQGLKIRSPFSGAGAASTVVRAGGAVEWR